MSVRLDSDSLYITTEPLMNGAFHWGLINIDSTGAASQHQWARDPYSPDTREEYLTQSIPEINASATGTRRPLGSILAFFKVDGYMPDPAFTDICKTAFSTSYATAQANREHGLTCRTWIMKVLNVLEERGSIMRGNLVASVEAEVVRRSEEQEMAYLESFMKREPYVAPVEPV